VKKSSDYFGSLYGNKSPPGCLIKKGKNCIKYYIKKACDSNNIKNIILRTGDKFMTERKDSYKREYRNIIIKTTDGSILSGKINIGMKPRVSELFTQVDTPFIVLSDVKNEDGFSKVLFVNKSNIVWVETKD
jgi:hypothetical protein